MKLRRFLIEGATLIISAIILGLVANAMAASDRRVSLVSEAQPSRSGVQSQQPSSTIIEDDAVMSSGEGDPLAEPGMAGQQPAAQAGAGTMPQNGAKASKSEVLERFPPSPDVPAEEIHTDQAEWLWKNGALFLDARRTSVYAEGHIPGARPMSVWEADVDEKVKAMSEEGLDPEMPVVIYCSGGECEDSHMLAQKLWGMFFNNLLVYYEGYPGWAGAGKPVRKGPQP